MALTELQIRNSKPREKIYKLYDGGGLVLRIKPNGSKLWEHKYRIPTSTTKYKEKALPLGKWPEISLKVARDRNVTARRLRDTGKDPAVERKKDKIKARLIAGDTFAVIALEWHTTNLPKWTKTHGERVWQRIRDYLLPDLGAMPIADVLSIEILNTIKKFEKTGKTETAHRLLQDCCSIFRFAVLMQKIKYNPARELSGALQPHIEKNLPSIDPRELPQFLERLHAASLSVRDRIAISLLMLTFLRTGELRKSMKRDVDFQDCLWEIDKENMKKRRAHAVPLSRQAMLLLDRASSLFPESEYLFPPVKMQKSPYMNENAINKIIHTMGYKGIMVGHGFRSLASTILNKHGFSEDAIELQLAHLPSNKTRAAYNRYKYLEERKQMMQWWGDYLENAGLVIG